LAAILDGSSPVPERYGPATRIINPEPWLIAPPPRLMGAGDTMPRPCDPVETVPAGVSAALEFSVDDSGVIRQ
jgi:hypothetical protein